MIGILSAKKTGELKAQIKEEDTLTTEIMGWAGAEYDRQRIG